VYALVPRTVGPEGRWVYLLLGCAYPLARHCHVVRPYEISPSYHLRTHLSATWGSRVSRVPTAAARFSYAVRIEFSPFFSPPCGPVVSCASFALLRLKNSRAPTREKGSFPLIPPVPPSFSQALLLARRAGVGGSALARFLLPRLLRFPRPASCRRWTRRSAPTHGRY
jgi:hypothetical protein